MMINHRFLRRPEVEARTGLSRGTPLHQNERGDVSETDAHRQAGRGVEGRRHRSLDLAAERSRSARSVQPREDGLTMSLQILDRLRGVRKTGERKWTAQCPAHDDRSPSLSIRECDDGKVLIHCFTGCDYKAILAAVCMKPGDLFPDRRPSA